MDLNHYQAFDQLDRQNMLGHIDGLPDQLKAAWEMGKSKPLPAWQGIQQVIIAGMGGSAISGDLLQAYVAHHCKIPMVVQRDYDLPVWARGEETLAIISSHSGNTEETLSAFEQAIANRCRTVAVTTGGMLAEKAAKLNTPCWQYAYPSQPRAAVGYSFSLMLAILWRLNLFADPSREFLGAIEQMKNSQKYLKADIPVTQNPAKRMAGQLIDRWVVIIASGILAPVARRMKAQINEISKAWAQYDQIPEANHNTLAGIENPGGLLSRMIVLFLRVPAEKSPNQKRLNLTKTAFMLQGLGTDFIDAPGNTPLANLWCSLHFGDYLAYYLAMSYDVDPTPVEIIEDFKREIAANG